MNKFNSIYKEVFVDNWDKKALCDYGTELSYTFQQFSEEIAKLHIIFESYGVQRGDKIAVLGKNSSHWAITFFASITYGAVIVPVLDEFNVKDVVHILNHSEAKLFFCDSWFNDKMDISKQEKLDAVFTLSDFKLSQSAKYIKSDILPIDVDALFKSKYPNGFGKSDLNFADTAPDDVVIINYTSGTTSLTKGVMIMNKSIAGNILFGREMLGSKLGKSLAILPIAHVYGMVVSVLMGLGCGGSVTFLGKIPSPTVLLAACADVKPSLLCFVPLIFEKIYKNKIKPTLNKPMMKFLCSLPFVKDIIYRKIGKAVYNQLGGEGLFEVIIGGAAINKEVEEFFLRAKFPFTVGYGMTECAPLISYSHYYKFAKQSVGLPIGANRAEVKILKENPKDNTGEIIVYGDHVMKGYFKDEEATKSTFTSDGWLRTGDLGRVDKDGNVYIMGRSKTMLLGPSGENIYPESIESRLMNLPFVAECIVLQNKAHKLVAFVYPDMAMLEQSGVPIEKLDRIMANNRRTINDDLAKFENIHRIEIVDTPFPKTPKNTVKRYGLDYLMKQHESNVKKKLVKDRAEYKKNVNSTK